MSLIVQKYGDSLGTPQRIQHVANRVFETQQAGNLVVVVVSAMSGVTDGLIKLANQLSPQPIGRELTCYSLPANKPRSRSPPWLFMRLAQRRSRHRRPGGDSDRRPPYESQNRHISLARSADTSPTGSSASLQVSKAKLFKVKSPPLAAAAAT